MQEIMKNFVDDLNNDSIAIRAMEELDKAITDLPMFGLEKRTESAWLEPIAIRLMCKRDRFSKYNLSPKVAQARSFYDLGLMHEGKTALMDHKACSGGTYDNINAQGAILYTLTGNSEYSEKNKRLNEKYLATFNKACGNVNDTVNNDFYYIILDKENEKYVLSSLRSLVDIQTNQSNFIQAKWNTATVEPRTNDEYIRWLSPYVKKYRYKTNEKS